MKGIAVGFFDGVHLGHQAILKGADVALTFSNHPLSVLAPENAPVLVMSPSERVEAIRSCGVEEVRMLTFTRGLAEMSPEEFVRLHFTGCSVRCGENWRFGRGGCGDAEFLREHGIPVEVVPYAKYKEGKISSSRIRACLARGEIADANAMLGRRFAVCGMRRSGKGIGTKIGFPTVNIVPERPLDIPLGVYEVDVGGRHGVANFGLAPTMGAGSWQEPVLEVHLLGSGRVDGEDGLQTPRVEFLRFIRPERKFSSVDELTRQIAADCREVMP